MTIWMYIDHRFGENRGHSVYLLNFLKFMWVFKQFFKDNCLIEKYQLFCFVIDIIFDMIPCNPMPFLQYCGGPRTNRIALNLNRLSSLKTQVFDIAAQQLHCMGDQSTFCHENIIVVISPYQQNCHHLSSVFVKSLGMHR